MLDLFGEPIIETLPVEKPKPVKLDVNPCLAVYGTGVEGQPCKGCVHLRYHPDYRARHWKCDMRRLTHGKATDHKVNWQSCGKYERRTEPYHGG